MKALSVLFGSMVEARSLALSAVFAAVVTLFAGTTQPAHAADQIRFKVQNDAGFTISGLVMWGNVYRSAWESFRPRKIANSGANIDLGNSGNVKFSLGDDDYIKIEGEVEFEYKIMSSPQVGYCSKKVKLESNSNKQFTKAVMPDGTDVSGELDPAKDQIIRVRFKVVGAVEDKKCRYQGYKVYKR